MSDEDKVREAEVDCKGDGCGHKTCPDCSGETSDIADKPDSEESERDAIRRALLIVFYELWSLSVKVRC